MSNFHEQTANGFSKRAEQAYVEYMNGGPASLLADAAWFEKQVVRHRAQIAPVAVPKPVKTKAPRVRCPHYKLIQRFFAIARDAGLDTSKAAKPRMRHALETLMGRCVDSRSEVSAGEWKMLGDAIKSGRLAW